MRSSSVLECEYRAWVLLCEYERELTLVLVLADVDGRRRRHHVGRKVVHHGYLSH